ncbi:MAG: DUF3465 domain-containing protein [Chloroflexota bacterium]|nr:DUF3465 domain-containing protein [Chloroflexota bacterium]
MRTALVAARRRAIVVCVVALATVCGPTATGNAGVEQAFAQRRSNVEVTATGRVERLLADERGASGMHQRFIVTLDGATQTVLVDNNVTIGERAPLAAGDAATIHGEYVWNAEGGLIHFTHHDPEHTHEGGWIEVRGTRYQ